VTSGYIQITDEQGNLAEITRADVNPADGEVHIINSVMTANTAPHTGV